MKGKKYGGRQKGTPNKDTLEKRAIKALLRDHSVDYITPHEVINEDGTLMTDDDGNVIMMSDLEIDLSQMKPSERAQTELKLLEFHTPKMQTSSIDIAVSDKAISIEDKLIELSQDG